jgi:hypothetical protein
MINKNVQKRVVKNTKIAAMEPKVRGSSPLWYAKKSTKERSKLTVFREKTKAIARINFQPLLFYFL